MFIKFDEYALQDFFEKEPVCIGEYEAGNRIYTIEENCFKLLMEVDTYKAVVELSVSYQGNLVFRGVYKNVEEIRKSDDEAMRIKIENESNSIVLKKGKQLGIIMETDHD